LENLGKSWKNLENPNFLLIRETTKEGKMSSWQQCITLNNTVIYDQTINF
jgi:hypothetical protein